MRWHSLVFLLVVLGSSACAPHDVRPADERSVQDWPLFSPPDGRFSIRMPSQPQSGRDGRTRTYTVSLGEDDLYEVDIRRLPDLSRVVTAEQLLDELRDSAIKPFLKDGSGHLLSSETGKTAGKPSATFLLELVPPGWPHSMALVKMIVDVEHHRFVMASHTVRAAAFDKARSTAFVDSLQVPSK